MFAESAGTTPINEPTPIIDIVWDPSYSRVVTVNPETVRALADTVKDRVVLPDDQPDNASPVAVIEHVPVERIVTVEELIAQMVGVLVENSIVAPGALEVAVTTNGSLPYTLADSVPKETVCTEYGIAEALATERSLVPTEFVALTRKV
jgi:hypothetical protein